MTPTWLIWLIVKYLLAAVGFVLWCGLWFQRSVWLGIAQVVICGLILRDELTTRWTTGRW